ncbi:MAG: ComF family protein [Desulfovibrio sp.]
MAKFFRKCIQKLQLASIPQSRCLCCGTGTDLPQTKKLSLCEGCAPDFRLRTGGYCPSCGQLSANTKEEPTTCINCRTTPPPWRQLCFFNEYKGELREEILQFKFNGAVQNRKLLGQVAFEAFSKLNTKHANEVVDIIVPVPLHPKRLFQRGFNQSQEVALQLHKKTGIPVAPTALIRNRHTQPQMTLSRKERLTNLEKAFSIGSPAIAGKRILLIDDVFTSGATLKECTTVLLKAGAVCVDILVLARA